jgi:ribose-phosphate pyrophosphokinase
MSQIRDTVVVTGNVSDNPFAIDIARLLGFDVDVSDLVSLKSFANTEFCPRFIHDVPDAEHIGNRLTDKTVIICSTSAQGYDRNSLAMRNLILARTAKDNRAAKIILVEPDLFYSAQDRGPHKYGDIEPDRTIEDMRKFDGQGFSSLLYAQLLKEAGVDVVLTTHNHSIKVQKVFSQIFDNQFHNLIPYEVYSDYIRKSDMVQCGKNGDNLVLVAPDKGAVPFMEMVYNHLDMPSCKKIILKKVRTGERHVEMSIDEDGSDIDIEGIEGKDLIVLDDMVRTGTTIVQCCELLKSGDPNKVCFGVTHFYTSPEARENLNSNFIDEIMTTNTIPTILNRDSQGRLRRKLTVLKIGKWITRHLNKLIDDDSDQYRKNFYSVDMSSQNPRWPPPNL